MQVGTEAVKEVENLELEELGDERATGPSIVGAEKYLDVVKDVEIRLSAVLGKANLTVGELFDLKSGGVLSLDKLTNEPLELLLNGQVVARGNLVVVEDNFGIQLTEVCEL